jgi:hypothetical protein
MYCEAEPKKEKKKAKKKAVLRQKTSLPNPSFLRC